jgi:hypothetical protein
MTLTILTALKHACAKLPEKCPPGEALPVELLPLTGDQPPHVLFRVTGRILHEV